MTLTIAGRERIARAWTGPSASEALFGSFFEVGLCADVGFDEAAFEQTIIGEPTDPAYHRARVRHDQMSLPTLDENLLAVLTKNVGLVAWFTPTESRSDLVYLPIFDHLGVPIGLGFAFDGPALQAGVPYTLPAGSIQRIL